MFIYFFNKNTKNILAYFEKDNDLIKMPSQLEEIENAKKDPNLLQCDKPPERIEDYDLDLETGKWLLNSLQQIKNYKINILNKINLFVEEKRKLLAGTTDYIEISSWNNKLRIAKSILNNEVNDNDKNAFQIEINIRNIEGENLINFSEKIIQKADFFSRANALIDGIRKLAIVNLNKCNTIEEMEQSVEESKKLAEEAFNDLYK